MKKKLRIGLLIDNYFVSSLGLDIIEQINKSEHSEVILIIKKHKKLKRKKHVFARRLWENRNSWFYKCYLAIENKLFKSYSNFFCKRDLRKIVNCSTLNVVPKQVGLNDIISQEDVNKIKSENVDILIKLGFNVLRGDILKCCKYGVWAYHHGDNSLTRGGPVGVYEVLDQVKRTAVTIQILNENLDKSLIIGKVFLAPHRKSIIITRLRYWWKSKSLLLQKLKELHSIGEDEFFKRVKKQTVPTFYFNRLRHTPTNFELLKLVTINGYKYLKFKIKYRFNFDQWFLLFNFENKGSSISRSFYCFNRILPPKDRFWADPFIIEKNNKYFIFIEELVFKEHKGKISVIEMDENGNYSSPKVVLKENYHLSYPFLIEQDGELYMIPETSQSKSIQAYKCVEFPLKWELSKILMNNIQALDTTILKYKGKYWMFTNIRQNKNKSASADDDLFLFYADDLITDKWIPHPCNPIVSDVKCSRPAGKIFTEGGRLFRPGQNCTNRYGYGIQIKEIVELNETRYQEITVQSIFPNWSKDTKCIHTLNHSGKLTVIDSVITRTKYF